MGVIWALGTVAYLAAGWVSAVVWHAVEGPWQTGEWGLALVFSGLLWPVMLILAGLYGAVFLIRLAVEAPSAWLRTRFIRRRA